jgi:predicted amino acid racemase
MVRRERSGPFPSLAIYAIMKFAARPARDVEDAVPYCGAGHIIDSRFSNIPKFRRGQVTTPYRLFHPPSHISNSLKPHIF